MIPIDKKTVLTVFWSEVGKKKESLLKIAENYRRSASESSKSTESWSDSSRTQFNMMGSAVEEEIIVLDRGLALLKNLADKAFARVEIGALAIVGGLSGEEKYYLLVPEGRGGLALAVGEYNIFAVSSGAPTGQALFGKQAGDEFELNGQKAKIVAIF